MTDNGSPLPPAGWHDDPNDPLKFRYWDGARWTDHRAPKQPAAANPLPPAGWHNDPNDPALIRYWDGAQWSGTRRDKASNLRGGEQFRLRRAVSPIGRMAAKTVSDAVRDAAGKVGGQINKVGEVADRTAGQANNAIEVAGDVADRASDEAGCVLSLLKRIAMVLLFPLWLVLILFGCGPLS